jgi:tRNA(fMet)-specific endonuclease VapC
VAPPDAVCARIRARLEQADRPIGGNDRLIAAHALALGHAVITDNDREFLRTEGLVCESSLRVT